MSYFNFDMFLLVATEGFLGGCFFGGVFATEDGQWKLCFFLCDHFSEIDFILLGGIELTKPITSEKAVMNFHLRGAFNLSSYVKPKTISFLSSLLLRDQQN